MPAGRRRSRRRMIWRARGRCCSPRSAVPAATRRLSAVHAPVLAGIHGRSVNLADGRVVRADAAYLRDSILQPQRDVVAGYQPIMPSFAGLVDEADLQRLVAYLQSLRGEATR